MQRGWDLVFLLYGGVYGPDRPDRHRFGIWICNPDNGKTFQDQQRRPFLNHPCHLDVQTPHPIQSQAKRLRRIIRDMRIINQIGG